MTPSLLHRSTADNVEQPRGNHLSKKLEYNQLPPVSRLPVELLPLIFSYLKAQPGYDEYSQKYDISLLWVPKATHVCHAWREAAIQDPFLWKDINVQASFPWAAEFARRSKDVPVCVNSRFDDDFFRQKTQIIWTRRILRETAGRVDKISLTSIGPEYVPLIFYSGSEEIGTCIPFNALQEFELDLSGAKGDFDICLLSDRIICAPTLKKLSLWNCFLDFEEFGPLKNISHLLLSFSPTDLVVDAATMHKAMLQMCNLEDLEIRVLFPWIIPPPPTDHPASLPRLCEIRIECFSVTWLFAVLRCIAFGLQRNLNIELDCNKGFDGGNAQIEDILGLFTCFTKHVQESSIRWVTVASGHNRFYFHGWRTAPKVFDPTVSFSAVLPQHLQIPSSLSSDHRDLELDLFLLNALFGRTRWENLEVLRIWVMMMPAKTWVDLLGNLPHLHTIGIVSDERQFFSALVHGVTTTPGDFDSDPATLPFQALRTIQILCRTDPYSGEDNNFMLKCLGKRSELKVPLKELEICFANETENHGLNLGALKEIVESVVVKVKGAEVV